MNENVCKRFLLKLFYTAYQNYNFFDSIKRFGVNFYIWPENKIFDQAKLFWKIANEKSHSAAVIQVDVEIPDEDLYQEISTEDVKLFYTKYLNYLRAIEASKQLRLKPEEAQRICESFLNIKTNTSNFFSLADLVYDFVEKNEIKIKEGSTQIILSEFPELSKLINGFNKGRVSIFTAYSGFGKTNLGLNFLRSIIKDKLASLYVNMEMESYDMTKRFLQASCNMDSYEFLNNNYISKISEIKNSVESLEKNFITDGSSLSISEIKSMVQEINRKKKLDFVIVDYDQKIIMDDFGIKEEWQYVKKAVEVLESIAKSEMVHVVLFAQTNEDSQGSPIASRRSIQPASAVVHFTKENDTPIFKFLKNRFGSTSEKIELSYDARKSFITEKGILTEVLPRPSYGFNYGAR